LTHSLGPDKWDHDGDLTTLKGTSHPLGDEFSSWFGFLDELGLKPAAVILSSLEGVNLVRAAVGIKCFVGLASNFVEVLLPFLQGKCRLGLVDG
jgi:hypothetical protein